MVWYTQRVQDLGARLVKAKSSFKVKPNVISEEHRTVLEIEAMMRLTIDQISKTCFFPFKDNFSWFYQVTYSNLWFQSHANRSPRAKWLAQMDFCETRTVVAFVNVLVKLVWEYLIFYHKSLDLWFWGCFDIESWLFNMIHLKSNQRSWVTVRPVSKCDQSGA